LFLAIAAVGFQSAENNHPWTIGEAIVRIGVVLQIVGNNQGRVRFVDFLELASNVPCADCPLVPGGGPLAMRTPEQRSSACDEAQRQ